MRGPVPTRPKNTGFRSGPGNDPALVARFGSLAVPNPEPLLTLDRHSDRSTITAFGPKTVAVWYLIHRDGHIKQIHLKF